MRTTFTRALLRIALAAGVLFWTLPGTAKELEKDAQGRAPSSLAKVSGNPIRTMININNIAGWIRADGQSAHNPSDQSGVFFPRGTAAAIYEDGIVWGAKAYTNAAFTAEAPNQLVRVGGQTYNQGTLEGRIIGTGASAVRAATNATDVRIYRIRRDFNEMDESSVARDASEIYHGGVIGDVTPTDNANIIAQYLKDWNEWPVQYGAPYIERNGTPGYQPPPAFTKDGDGKVIFGAANLISGNYDEPGIAGVDPTSPADQVVWTVCNDLDQLTANGLYGSDPTGIEVQITLWGYKRTDALGNLYFKKFRLINKGGVEIDAAHNKGSFWLDSMYVAQWSDPDMGGSGDDLTACDTTLSLGYVYNGQAVDANYKAFNLPPPAVGYDFLQGPLLAGAVDDSAVFNLKRVYGKKNLPMTSFAWFAAGSAISDPALRSYNNGTMAWWRMLQGYVPDQGNPPWKRYPAFPGDQASPWFPLSGDPVTGKGAVDGLGELYSFPPGDRRLALQSGPFRFAPGDTQEVVIGVVAGIGSDRKSSITVMKFNDEFVQNTYNALFSVPKAPASPDVKVAELDGKVVLEWGSNAARIAETEEKIINPGAFAFEGYNVYQFESAGSSLTSENTKRVATYDVVTDPTVILDRVVDPSGVVLNTPVQFGTNSGITRKFVFTRDYVKDVDRMSNGTPYYVGVTAYSYSTGGYTPISLESSPTIITVIPQLPKPGTRYAGAIGDTVKGVTVVPAGASDGAVIPIVVNPTALTGHKYRVSFNDVVDTVNHITTTFWSVTDVTLSKVVLKDQANQTGDDNYLFIDGMLIKVSGPPPGMKSWSIPSGTRRFSPVGGFAGLGLEGFSNAGDPTAYDEATGTIGRAGNFAFGGIGTTLKVDGYKNVLLKLAAVDNVNLWDPKATPTDVNFSRAYRYLRSAASAAAQPSFAPWITNPVAGYPFQGYDYSVPFSAWNMETNPPTRLAVGHFENNVAAGAVDGRYWPGLTTVDNSVTREFAFIFSAPYTGDTQSPALAVNISNNASTPLMWIMTCARRAEAAWVTADQFLITANHVNTPSVSFEFTAPANTVGDVTTAKADVGKIGVFPNPYYAFNPNETNRLAKFVTFNRLPAKATLRIFNLAGQLVRTLEKNDPTQFLTWDLNNRDAFPVASGMYIVHVDMPDLGATKILKVAVIQEQEVPTVY